MYLDTHTIIECMNFEGLAKSLAAVMAFVICVSDWSGGTDASIGVFIELCTTIWFLEDHSEPQPAVWWWPNFALNIISLCKTLRCKKFLFRCVCLVNAQICVATDPSAIFFCAFSFLLELNKTPLYIFTSAAQIGGILEEKYAPRLTPSMFALHVDVSVDQYLDTCIEHIPLHWMQ